MIDIDNIKSEALEAQQSIIDGAVGKLLTRKKELEDEMQKICKAIFQITGGKKVKNKDLFPASGATKLKSRTWGNTKGFIMDIISTLGDAKFSPADVVKLSVESGKDLTADYASNLLAILFKEGKITRLSKGVYTNN